LSDNGPAVFGALNIGSDARQFGVQSLNVILGVDDFFVGTRHETAGSGKRLAGNMGGESFQSVLGAVDASCLQVDNASSNAGDHHLGHFHTFVFRINKANCDRCQNQLPD